MNLSPRALGTATKNLNNNNIYIIIIIISKNVRERTDTYACVKYITVRRRIL